MYNELYPKRICSCGSGKRPNICCGRRRANREAYKKAMMSRVLIGPPTQGTLKFKERKKKTGFFASILATLTNTFRRGQQRGK